MSKRTEELEEALTAARAALNVAVEVRQGTQLWLDEVDRICQELNEVRSMERGAEIIRARVEAAKEEMPSMFGLSRHCGACAAGMAAAEADGEPRSEGLCAEHYTTDTDR